MEIKLVVNHYHEPFGVPRYNQAITEYLAQLGIHYELLAPETPRFISATNRITRKIGYDLEQTYLNYPLFIQPRKGSLVHLTNHTLSTLLFFNSLGMTIITAHDIESDWEHFRDRYTGKRYAFYRILHRISLQGLKRSNWIITDTFHVKNQIHKRLGIKLEKIFVIPLAIDHSIFHAEAPKLPRNRNEKRILHVGTYAPRKNFQNLIYAFALVKQRFPEIKLFKVGRPNWKMEYERSMQLILELGLQDHIIFQTGLNDVELAELYRSADCLVFPSFYEGFGFPILEAMACGTPVITSNSSCLPEVAGDAAIFINPDNIDEMATAISRVLSDMDLAHELRNRGLRRAKEFHWEDTAKKTIEAYEIAAGMKF